MILDNIILATALCDNSVLMSVIVLFIIFSPFSSNYQFDNHHCHFNLYPFETFHLEIKIQHIKTQLITSLT